VGLFEGATPLNTTYFRETWDKLHEVLQGVEKDTKILTYCTGGIRCVKVKIFSCSYSLFFVSKQSKENRIEDYS